EHLEVDQVVLVSVRLEIAEQPSAEVAIVKDETAEVGVEALNTAAKRGCVEERAVAALTPLTTQEGQESRCISNTILCKGFLQRDDSVTTSVAAAIVDSQYAVLANVGIVDIEVDSGVETPVGRLERRITLEEICFYYKILLVKELSGP